ncbi:hypothetical protein PAXINDRAFT_156449 [Paxillus involutus ATCC 200175]|uniref:Uncharacterized protein n=1 Tax=Paxillus involutus ATCC 200175 TaxID=664439 RepID=A0A0C9U1Y2_PAXIN|nr:hypothetical protein PAXINDRAFT_156449 [Paxillus involutus ATCC 200175]
MAPSLMRKFDRDFAGSFVACPSNGEVTYKDIVAQGDQAPLHAWRDGHGDHLSIGDEPPQVQVDCLAGEALGDNLFEHWSGRVTLDNVCGPTEASTDCTTCPVTPPSITGVIGRPLANFGTYILDKQLRWCRGVQPGPAVIRTAQDAPAIVGFVELKKEALQKLEEDNESSKISVTELRPRLMRSKTRAALRCLARSPAAGVNFLMAVQAAGVVSKTFNVHIGLSKIYLRPTTCELGTLVVDGMDQDSRAIMEAEDADADFLTEVLPIKKKGIKPRLYIVHDTTGMATPLMRLGAFMPRSDKLSDNHNTNIHFMKPTYTQCISL